MRTLCLLLFRPIVLYYVSHSRYIGECVFVTLAKPKDHVGNHAVPVSITYILASLGSPSPCTMQRKLQPYRS